MKKTLLVILVLGVLMMLGTGLALAQQPTQTQATYVGSTTCFNCHPALGGGPSKAEFEQTLHPWKVRPKAEATIVGTFPVTDVNGMAWTLADVDWVIGARGTGWKQRYIKIIDGAWRILPIQWNIATQQWVPYNPTTWMQREYRDLCAGCHTTGYNVDTKEWKEPGVWCEACHGPGSDHVAGGFARPGDRKIVKSPDAEICGQCHIRGLDKATGTHEWPVGYFPGGSLHIEDVYNYDWSPASWWFDLLTNPTAPGHAKGHHQQYMEYQNSKHAAALTDLRASGHAQDRCLQCHSEDYRRAPTDSKPTVDTARYPITCITCHTTHNAGAAAHQMIKPVYDTCVECHTGSPPADGKFAPGSNVHHPVKEMFEGTGFPGLTDIPSRHFAQAGAGPVCSTCHLAPTAKSAVAGDIKSHLLTPVKPAEAKSGEGDSCTTCHTEVAVGKAWLQDVIDRRQADIRTELTTLQARLAASQAISNTTAYKTAYTARTMVQSEGSLGLHNSAYAKAILAAANAALGYTNTLQVVKATGSITLDGVATDTAWTAAPELDIPSLDVKMKGVYTDQDLYLLVTWRDATASFTRSDSWSWSGTAWVKSAGQSEDRVAILWDKDTPGWAAEGCGIKCHPGANEPGTEDDAWLASGKADSWHMKAARNLPAISATQVTTITVDPATHQVTAGTIRFDGYVDDKWVGQYSAANAPDGGRYGDAGSSGYANNRSADKTSPKYMETAPTDFMDAMVLRQSEIDAGEAVEVSTLTPDQIATYWARYAALNAVVPERILTLPTSSRGDIRQAAVWKDGVWTLEFKRALNTGHPDDDTIFSDLTKTYGFGVATMDNTGGDEHKDAGLKFNLVFKPQTTLYLPLVMKNWP